VTPLLYHCPTAPDSRRWIAQFPRLSDNLYLTVHGPTADIARAKAQLMHEFGQLPPQERKVFDLKGRLAALGGPTEDVNEDELL
jgi:hypothetical protein